MWGCKKGLWITSYLGYLQSYFDITFYDSRELANLDVPLQTAENLHKAFNDGGLDTAVKHLIKKEKEKEPGHYLAFCAGATTAWKAALKGLPIKSLYAISPFNLDGSLQKPDIPIHLLHGEYHKLTLKENCLTEDGLILETVPKFGHELYTDEKIIRKVCLDLLESKCNIRYQDVG